MPLPVHRHVVKHDVKKHSRNQRLNQIQNRQSHERKRKIRNRRSDQRRDRHARHGRCRTLRPVSRHQNHRKKNADGQTVKQYAQSQRLKRILPGRAHAKRHSVHQRVKRYSCKRDPQNHTRSRVPVRVPGLHQMHRRN